jgi:spore maturation protein CgeB
VRFAGDDLLLSEHLICRSQSDWFDKLDVLVGSADLREEVGDAMFARVQSRYNMEERIDEWRKVFES